MGSPARFPRSSLALLALVALAACGAGPAPSQPPLVLERTIVLPGVSGRIDHLALDREGGRLFVAALGNNTVEVVDLRRGLRIGQVGGLSEPQGLAWLPDRRELVVASGDGQVGFYGGEPLRRAGGLKLGDDADNIRLDATGRPVVGYGAGALAVVDPARRMVVASASLPGHPESFRLEGGRAHVNVPDAARIVTVDLATGTQLAAWPTPRARFNFPMALEGEVLAVAFRLPARLRLLDRASGRLLADVAACGDADDLFFDSPRRRLYLICGSGQVGVFQTDGRPISEVTTRRGARTGLFSPADDRLYVAARAEGNQPAAILVYRPAS